MIDKHGKSSWKLLIKKGATKKIYKIKKPASGKNWKKKSSKNVLLKDVIYGEDEMLLNYYENFTKKGRDIIKKRAKDESIVNYNDLFF